MNRIALPVMLMVFCASNTLVAQEYKNSDSLYQPSLYLEDEIISYENFPAASDDGTRILIIDQQYSCCVSHDIVFHVFDPKRDALSNEIVLIPGELNEEEIPSAEKEKNVATIRAFLLTYKCRSMAPIDSFEVVGNESSKMKQVQVIISNTLLRSIEFTLPDCDAASYCCGDDESPIPCTLTNEVQNVWLDSNQRFILIEYGVVSARDGCDYGPHYRVILIK
ncbi:MAG: hypothetical protein KKD31_19195 [Bacteroidetes bacterium]|nr:hypothetical protein [Bacteroidota bacterium]